MRTARRRRASRSRPTPFTGAPINPGQATGPIRDKSASFKQLEPKISLSWKPNAVTNIYANWGVGFKAGGFNNTGSQATINAAFNNGAPGTINTGVVINDNYRKERSSAFEAGIKGSLFDGRINYDLAGYYTRIRDMQFFEFFVGCVRPAARGLQHRPGRRKGRGIQPRRAHLRGWKVFGAFN